MFEVEDGQLVRSEGGGVVRGRKGLLNHLGRVRPCFKVQWVRVPDEATEARGRGIWSDLAYGGELFAECVHCILIADQGPPAKRVGLVEVRGASFS